MHALVRRSMRGIAGSILAVLLCVALALALRVRGELHDSVDAIRAEAERGWLALERVERTLFGFEAILRHYLVTGEARARADLEADRAELAERLASLRNTLGSAAARESLATAEEIFGRWQADAVDPAISRRAEWSARLARTQSLADASLLAREAEIHGAERSTLAELYAAFEWNEGLRYLTAAIERDLERRVSQHRGYLLSGDARHREGRAAAATSLARHLGELRQRAPEQAELVDTLAALARVWKDEIEAVQLHAHGERGNAAQLGQVIELVSAALHTTTLRALRGALQTARVAQHVELARVEGDVATRLLWSSLSIAALSLLLVVLASILLRPRLPSLGQLGAAHERSDDAESIPPLLGVQLRLAQVVERLEALRHGSTAWSSTDRSRAMLPESVESVLSSDADRTRPGGASSSTSTHPPTCRPSEASVVPTGPSEPCLGAEDDIFHSALLCIAREQGTLVAALYVTRGGPSELYCRLAVGRDGTALDPAHFVPCRLHREVVRSGRCVEVRGPFQIAGEVGLGDPEVREASSVVGWPLSSRGTLLGVLMTVHVRECSASAKRFIESIADLVASRIALHATLGQRAPQLGPGVPIESDTSASVACDAAPSLEAELSPSGAPASVRYGSAHPDG